MRKGMTARRIRILCRFFFGFFAGLAWLLEFACPTGYCQELPGLSDARIPESARMDIAILAQAYPGTITGVAVEAGHIAVVTAGGTRFVYDDGRVKTEEQALEETDLEDMLAQVYEPGPVREDIPDGWHPGRRRVTDFFEEVYGRDPAQVSANSRRVRFLDTTVLFSAKNGAADALERVSARLADRVSREPGLREALYPVVGTFCWRTISGTKRLSMHALAIAIDLNPGRNPYWRHHRKPSAALAKRTSFPGDVVADFEAEGFIWGGKWAEYDIMHFEYRPELLMKARGNAAHPSTTSARETPPARGDVAQ